MEREPCPISAWDLSDGYKFPGIPFQLSALPAHCGNSLTYIPMVTGRLPPANITATACKVSILLRHPIPAHPDYCGQMYHCQKKTILRHSTKPPYLPVSRAFNIRPIHLSKLPLLLETCSLSHVTPIFQTCYLFPCLPDFGFTVSLSF